MTTPLENLSPREIIVQGSQRLGIPLEEDSVSRMLRHLEMVRQWQVQMNLTSVLGLAPAAIYHCLDSLVPLKVIPQDRDLHMLDVGSGAGFPGLVIHSARPSIAVTVMDKNPKKIVFMKNVAYDLGFSRVSFLLTSVNALLDNPTPPGFDLVISRAFSSDPSVIDRFHGLLRTYGCLIRMAGPSDRDGAFALSRFEPINFWEGTLPFSERYRRVIVYQRTGSGERSERDDVP